MFIVADVGGALSVNGTNVGSAAKTEPQAVNVKSSRVHPADRSRSTSKSCMFCVKLIT